MSKLHVLIPLDGSDFSRYVLPNVCHLFHPDMYKLTLLHVSHLPELPADAPNHISGFDGWTTITDWTDSIREMRKRNTHQPRLHIDELAKLVENELLQDLGSAKDYLEEAGFDVDVSVRFGEADKEIPQFVNYQDVDFVAMATHGRSGLGRVVMGSVAEKVLRNLTVPVMMVRPISEHARQTRVLKRELAHSAN